MTDVGFSVSWESPTGCIKQRNTLPQNVAIYHKHVSQNYRILARSHLNNTSNTSLINSRSLHHLQHSGLMQALNLLKRFASFQRQKQASKMADVAEATTADPEDTSQSPFPYEKLSPEIRAMILKELLVMPGPIETSYFGARFAVYHPLKTRENPLDQSYSDRILTREESKIPQAPVCQIFLVSKGVYREAVPIYFGSNLFKFHNLDNFHAFARWIGPDPRWQLRKVAVDYDGNAPARAVKFMVECVGLRELEINIRWWSLSKYPTVDQPLQLFGQKDLLRIRGLEKIQVNFQGCISYYQATEEATQAQYDAFTKTLEVLKQPHDARTLKRQEAKDFPQKAKRTVFGKANVQTRSEREMLDMQSRNK